MIINIGSTSKKTTIDELHGGDCFYFNGWCYMKLAYGVIDSEGHLTGYNSTCLEDGCLTLIGKEDKIIPVKAVVTIDFKKC